MFGWVSFFTKCSEKNYRSFFNVMLIKFAKPSGKSSCFFKVIAFGKGTFRCLESESSIICVVSESNLSCISNFSFFSCAVCGSIEFYNFVSESRRNIVVVSLIFENLKKSSIVIIERKSVGQF